MSRSRALVVALVLGVALSACGTQQKQGSNTDPEQVDAVEAPPVGVCRVLEPSDIAAPANATRTVPCKERHTAQTYAVGPLPDRFDRAGYDSPEVAAFAYQICTRKLMRHIGADESLALRTLLQWAWFRPSEKAWSKGARWYRCDVVGGGDTSSELAPLPESVKGILADGPSDKWLVCVQGPNVTAGAKVPCSAKHDWRAVTTIKLGEPEDAYPGDHASEVTTRDYCSDSVGAWLGYPDDYDYGYTYFHEAEWRAGNRRSICWAKTTR